MISDLIQWEGVALLSSIFWGIVYAAIYDGIRIIRRIIRHKKVWLIFIEDIIYWLYVGIHVFCITFQLNDGVVRGFSLAGYVIGAVIYHYTLGWLIMNYVTKVILFILKPLKKLASLIKMMMKKFILAYKIKRVEQAKKAKQESIRKKEERRIKEQQRQEAEQKRKEEERQHREAEQKCKEEERQRKSVRQKSKKETRSQEKKERRHKKQSEDETPPNR